MAEGEDLWVRVTWRSLNLVGLLPLASGGEEGTGSCEVIVVSEADGKLVVAVPSTAWARKLAERRLPRGSLSKVVSVEVAAVSPEERGLLVEGATVKLWVGLLDPALMGSLSFEGTEAADLPFAQDAHGVGLLPHAASLVASVENLPGLGHFASAESGAGQDPASAGINARVDRLEAAMSKVGQTRCYRRCHVWSLLLSLTPSGPQLRPSDPSRLCLPT